MPLPKNLPQQSKTQAKNGASFKREGGTAPRVLANRYRLEQRLGSGAFGTVFLVTDLKAGNERKVLKQIVVAELQPDETVDAVREARLLAKLDHPAIVKFHDSFLEKEFFCIVTEYCEGGDLSNKIRRWKEAGRSFEETLILDWFIQLTTALMYIHERRILHRDVKTRNIFLKNNLIKLGDFGISRILMSTTDLATTFSGTPQYVSPEVVKHEGYNSKSDIWSLGVVLYELCTLEHAFPGQNLMSVMYKIVEGEKPQLPAHFNPSLRELFGSMLDKSPQQRPSAMSILQDPFIQQRMESLCRKVSVRRTPSTSHQAVEEAQAIAKALSPVKKKSLQGSQEGSLTPRQQLALRKKEQADRRAEERKRLAAENFTEGRKRFKEQRKKHARVVPPWVEEHPDVFNDPNFSITDIESTASLSDPEVSMEMSAGPHPPQEQEQLQQPEASETEEHSNENPQAMSLEGPSAVAIPEDPSLAETHYSQFDDFEEVSSSEDEYEAFLECIEDALDLSNSPVPESPRTPEPPHDEVSPFTSQAREKKIALLRAQCQQIYGEEEFGRVYRYLKDARSQSAQTVDESHVISGLRPLTSNFRDCFLVDQLVFLEKQDMTSAFT